jgi:hypothetical protein
MMMRLTVPIKDASLYPDNWKWIRSRILLRAQDRCEGSPKYPDCRAQNYKPHPVTGSKVVLTVAHLNRELPLNNGEENLRAWCQRCHLTYDAGFHANNARATRRSRKAMRELFPEAP